MSAVPFVTTEPHGIHVVDTGFHRPNFDAAYLMVERGRGAFIDTGTSHSLPRLLAALEAAGLARAEVDYVIVTHVHLDHAGGAGVLMRELPNAKLVVHPRGARHMIDPAALLVGARAVYGDEEVARSYGEVPGVAAERVIATSDGMTLELAGRPLQFIDTPGHARHHHCIWDARSRAFFTGDTFGLSYREFDNANGPWILPTTTPVQFEPDALKASVQRMLSFGPERMYLTHYGGVGDVARLGATLVEQIDAMAALGRSVRDAADRHAALRRGVAELHASSAIAHGCGLRRDEIERLLAVDIELNAQGLGIWLDREAA